MSNRKNSRGVNITYDNTKTITENFKIYLQEHKDIPDIIAFLAAMNGRAAAIVTDNTPSDDFKQEVIDFYNYFMDEFDDVTASAREEEWGKEPLILRLGEDFYDEENRAIMKQGYDSLDKMSQVDVSILCDKIWKIKKDRKIIMTSGKNSLEYFIARSGDENDSASTKEYFLHLCGYCMANDCVMVVRCFDRDMSQEVFAVSFKDGYWQPVPTEVNITACEKHFH